MIDKNEFNEIYETYFNDVYRYLISLCRNDHIAEEITQETFFRAMKSINQFHGQCKPFVWLCQIAKNTYFSHYKKYRKKKDLIEDYYDFFDLEAKVEDKETAKELHLLLHNMEDPYKEVFTLRIFGELPFSQIAELFGKTESWARVTFHRAKLRLKEELK